MCSFSVVVDGRAARMRRGRSTARDSGRRVSSEEPRSRASRPGRGGRVGPRPARPWRQRRARRRERSAFARSAGDGDRPAAARTGRGRIGGACGPGRETRVLRSAGDRRRDSNGGDVLRRGLLSANERSSRGRPRSAPRGPGQRTLRLRDAHARRATFREFRAARPREGRAPGPRARSRQAWRCAPRDWAPCRGPTAAARPVGRANSSRRSDCRAGRT